MGCGYVTDVPICLPAVHRSTNLDQVHKALESSYANMPQPQDTEKCAFVFLSFDQCGERG